MGSTGSVQYELKIRASSQDSLLRFSDSAHLCNSPWDKLANELSSHHCPVFIVLLATSTPTSRPNKSNVVSMSFCILAKFH